MTHCRWIPSWRYSGHSREEYRDAADNPTVIHFAGKPKPWDADCPTMQLDQFFLLSRSNGVVWLAVDSSATRKTDILSWFNRAKGSVSLRPARFGAFKVRRLHALAMVKDGSHDCHDPPVVCLRSMADTDYVWRVEKILCIQIRSHAATHIFFHPQARS